MIALQGVRILDLTGLLPGPYCTMILARQGADVIKIEPLGPGDPMRVLARAIPGGEEIFRAVNRGKRSLTLNLKSDAGRDIALRLADRSDVLVEGFRPGVMERLGLGWETLRERIPRLVYCSITGFGRKGAWSEQPGHDLSYMGMAGLVAPEGSDGPVAVPATLLADLNSGLCAAFAISLALLERALTGKGRFVDAAMTRSLLPYALPAVAALKALEKAGEVGGEPLWFRGGWACYGVYRASDGRHVTLAAIEPKFWAAFCEAAERPDLLDGYLEPERQKTLRAEISRIIASRDSEEWARLGRQSDICVSPAWGPLEALDEAGLPGDVWMDPFGCEEPDFPPEAAEPGAHARGILVNELGFEAALVDRWKSEGVI